MELSNEDSLRLHVLLNNVEAIRIDEQTLTVYGLSRLGETATGASLHRGPRLGPIGEAKVTLNPNCRPDQYLRRVRQFLSGAVLGSPDGYPVHLIRWTRMGQIDGNLAELLMLGEREAVAAVACAPGLTDDLARRVWWIEPTSENARRILARPDIVRGSMGKILADHLIEHLPFETEAAIMLDTVRLLLQPGLINEPTRMKLWERGARQSAYRVAFLEMLPDKLPQPLPAHSKSAEHQTALRSLAETGNPFAAKLLWTLSSLGQTYTGNCQALVTKVDDTEVIASLLNTIGTCFAPVRVSSDKLNDINLIVNAAEAAIAVAADDYLRVTLEVAPTLKEEIKSLFALSLLSEAVITSILARTTATGALLRRKLAPVTEVIAKQLGALRGPVDG